MSRKKRGLYFIEQILDYKQYNGQKYYLVKWQGYNNRDCTWEKPDKIPNLTQFLHQFEENVKNNGSNFYHIQNDEPPQLEDFIGVPSKSKQNQHQHQQEQIKILQNQVDQLKSEIDLMKKQQDELVQLITTNQQNEKTLQPNQQQDSEIIQESTSEQSQKNTEIKLQCEGGFEFGDLLDKIGQAVQVKDKGHKMYYLLWQKRPNGIVPKNRWVNSEYLMKHDINTLCYYLQKKL
ncbi:unnamed protein product (macronuclear) [Paramecium tetraurelia]|uniref:Chromo domain-containing protein n=1 Tax=Paramecium tetraurelia TaxID=5888 RepID=A0CAM7_PARTE|nr:uncharacterized protein GSPATT00036625001 [Paramecium tetraurelia]CAK67844.1 unnamed protein product [Paramecium tetraurelia]|eukprot:XP_001435241.1 hypothetical protein (macronuclear) [Paramecium tetraurelia strain d4-2]